MLLHTYSHEGKDSYFNMDVGASYNYLDFYAHATVQGLLETRRDLYTDYESDNLRKYLLSAGYVFGKRENITWEPSILFQLFDKTKEDGAAFSSQQLKEKAQLAQPPRIPLRYIP